MKKLTKKECSIVEEALQILENKAVYKAAKISSPKELREYAMLKLSRLEREEFHVVFLNNRHAVIKCERMAIGTIDCASVYPREIARRTLQLNAAAVILMHNHPSGEAEPSAEDIALTNRIRDALCLLDVRTLDHLIVGGNRSTSLAERGLL